MRRYTDILADCNYYLFLAVVALLPFPQIFLRYACVLWFVAWVLEGRWLRKPNSQSPISNLQSAIPFLLFGAWYGWKLLSGLWATDTAAWASQMERYISFSVMIPVGIWGVNERYNWRQAGKILVGGCVCAALFYPILLTVLLFHREIIDATNWVAPWDYSSFDWLYFYQINLSHIKHRLFLSSVEIMGIMIATKLWFNERRQLWFTASVLLTCSILLSGSRQALISLVVIAIIALFFLLAQRIKWYYAAGIVIVALVIGGMALSFHPRFRTLNIQSDERTLLWETALQHPMDYFWRGFGGGQDGVQLFSAFPESKAPEYFTVRGHCHNQYLQELREGGIVGLILFLLAWISVPLCASKKQKELAILFTVLFACNMCTECMFAKYCGVALWSVGLLFLLLQTDAAREQ